MKTTRRAIIKSAFTALPLLTFPKLKSLNRKRTSSDIASLKLSLNAFSFNQYLREGKMTLDELLDFTADHHIPALDLTAYYFPTYPEVPDNAFLYEIKRKAQRRGLVFSGTGVRNNFTQPDAEKRAKDVQLVRQWIDAAAKLGAPVIRIFAGPDKPEGYADKEITKWMLASIRQCVSYGKQRGVIVALQNHNEFIRTAEQVQSIMDAIQSEWFGLMLDIGSYRSADPYTEIADTASYAVNWQIKENVYQQQQEEKTDIEKLLSIILDAGYRGYLPLETLGPGDPYQKVTAFLGEVRRTMDSLGTLSRG